MTDSSSCLTFMRKMEEWIAELPQQEQILFTAQNQLFWAIIMHGPTSQRVSEKLSFMKTAIASCREVDIQRDPHKTLRECLFGITDGLVCIVEMIRDPVLRSTRPPESLANIDKKINRIRSSSPHVANVLLAQIDFIFLIAEHGVSQTIIRHSQMFKKTIVNEESEHKLLRAENSMERMVFRMAKCFWLAVKRMITGETVDPNEDCGCCEMPRVDRPESNVNVETVATEDDEERRGDGVVQKDEIAPGIDDSMHDSDSSIKQRENVSDAALDKAAEDNDADDEDSDIEVAFPIIKPIKMNENGEEIDEEEKREEEEGIDKLFACVFCGHCLTSSKQLDYHVKTRHKVNREAKKDESDSEEEESRNKTINQSITTSSEDAENESSTHHFLVEFAAKHGKPLDQILALNDILWNSLPHLESHLNKEEIRECKALAGDSVDKLSLAYLVSFLNKWQKKNNDLKTRLERIYMTAESESIARTQLKKRKIYLVAIAYDNDPNSHYIFAGGAITPVRDLRRAILTMIAVIDLDNLLFDPLIEDISSFFYLSAECRLPKIKEGVKKVMEIIKC